MTIFYKKQQCILFNKLLFVFFLLFGPLANTAYAAPTFNKTFNPAIIGPGSTSTLTFSITNDATPVTSINFTDNLPAGITLSASANPTQNCDGELNATNGGSSITFDRGRLGANQSCVITVNVTGSTLGTFSNISGDLTSSDGNSGNATADLTITADRPGFSKRFTPNSVSLGERSSLTFTIDNSANTQDARSLTFSDTLPNGMIITDPANLTNTCGDGVLSANPGSNVVSFNPIAFGLGTLAAGATCQISVDVVTNTTGVLMNTSGELTTLSATVFQPRSSGFAVADLAVDVTTVNLIKTFLNDPVAPGSTVDLNFNITNRDRRSSATNISFSDDLSSSLSGLAAVGLPATDVCGSGSSISGTNVITLSGGSLAGGETCTFNVTLQVPANAPSGGFTNLTSLLTADLNGNPIDGNMASDTLFVSAGPSLTKTFLSNAIGSGDTVTMEFTINNGSTTSAASDINFSDNLTIDFIDGAIATGLPLNDACGIGSSLSTFAPDFEQIGIQLTDGNLPADGSCTFSVDVIIPSGASDGVETNTTSSITATIDGVMRVGDPAQASINIVTAPELVKLFTDDPVRPGGTVTLEFTLANTEESIAAATDIMFTDDLDATLTGLIATGLPVNDVCGVGSELTGSSVLTLTGGSLEIGESCTFSVTLAVPADAIPGNYVNQTSQVSANANDLETSGPGGSDTLTVAGLDLSKSFLQNPVIAGATVTMELVLTNTSTTLDASSIVFTDNLNDFISGTAVVSALPINDVCGIGSSLTASGSFLIFQGGNLLAGESCTLSLDLVIPTGIEDGVFRNTTSTLTASIGGGNVVLTPATATLEVSSESLALDKDFTQGSISLGSSTSLDFVLTNLNESQTVTDISFSDDLDATLSGLFATGLPVNDVCGAGSALSGSSVITLTGGVLAPGASCAFTVELQTPASAEGVTSVTNTTSSVSGLVGDLTVIGGAASDSAIVVNVDYSKTFSNPTIAGDTATLSFSIQNNGGAALDRLFFTDDLEAVVSGLTAMGLPVSDVCGEGSIVTGSSVVTLTGGILEPGESCQFDVTVNIPANASGSFENITSTLRNDPLDVAAPAIAPLEILVRDATFEKSFSSAANPGGSTTLSFDIQNTGTADLNSLAFSDDLDAVLSGLTASGLPLSDICGTGSTLSGTSSITLSGGSLAAGTSCQFSVQIDVPANSAPGDFTNTTSALSEGDTIIADPASADLTVNALPAASFSKSFSGAVVVGGSTNLVFEINNTGSIELRDLAFSDDLNAALAGLTASGLPISDVCGVGSSLSGTSTITLSGGNLLAGTSCQFSVQVDVPAGSATGNFINTTSVLTESGDALADPATAQLTVNPANDGKITVCVKPGTSFQRELNLPVRLAKLFIRFGIAVEGSCPAPEPKVKLCHRSYKWYGYWPRVSYRTIWVKPHKVKRHLWHGDRLGSCKVRKKRYRY